MLHKFWDCFVLFQSVLVLVTEDEKQNHDSTLQIWDALENCYQNWEQDQGTPWGNAKLVALWVEVWKDCWYLRVERHLSFVDIIHLAISANKVQWPHNSNIK